MLWAGNIEGAALVR